jgi:hypothetical protein
MHAAYRRDDGSQIALELSIVLPTSLLIKLAAQIGDTILQKHAMLSVGQNAFFVTLTAIT